MFPRRSAWSNATVDSVSELLTRAGFTVTEAVTGSFSMRYAGGSALLHHYFIQFGFLPSWKAIVPHDSVERTFDLLEKS